MYEHLETQDMTKLGDIYRTRPHDLKISPETNKDMILELEKKLKGLTEELIERKEAE